MKPNTERPHAYGGAPATRTLKVRDFGTWHVCERCEIDHLTEYSSSARPIAAEQSHVRCQCEHYSHFPHTPL